MKNVIVCIIAPKGRGKTFAMSKAVGEMERVAVFDMIHEQAYGICEPIVGNPKQFAQMIHPSREQFKVAYRPIVFQNDEKFADKCPELEPFIKLCYLRGNMWMIIDEAHLICNSRNCPNMLLTSNFLGRHRELSIGLVAQRWTGIHRDITNNSDEFLFWKIVEPADLNGIRERCGEEVMRQVQQLRALENRPDGTIIPGQCLRWNNSVGVVSISDGAVVVGDEGVDTSRDVSEASQDEEENGSMGDEEPS